MEEVPENVKEHVGKLVPESLINDTTCFAFYDYHPLSRHNIEIIICTTNGEVIELYKRESVLTVILPTVNKPTQLSINRSSKCDIFYLVLAGDEFYVLARKDELVCDIKVCNVVSYQVYDFNNLGEPHLRVTLSDDAVPVIFDEEFKILTDKIHDLSITATKKKQVNIPMETDLDVKLAITRYNYAYNVKSLENMKNLRHVAAFTHYQRIHPNLNGSIFNSGLQEIRGALMIKSETPWIKTCNMKVVLIIPICNGNSETLEEVQILLHGCDSASITYTTKLFQNTPEPPYWQEVKAQNLTKDIITSIAVVVDLKELKNSVMSKIEFDGVIMYKLNGKEKLLPLEKVSLSILDILQESFDVLSSNEFDKNDLLAIIATSQRTDLLLRCIQQERTSVLEAFSSYLNMERLAVVDNAIAHRRSAYHALNGVIVMFERENENNKVTKASVYSRNESQVLYLIHYINDAVPGRIVITTPNQKVTAHHGSLLLFNEVTTPQFKQLNLGPLATALLEQMALLLKYYDDCMIMMNESRSENVVSKVGLEIDVFACGVPKFQELRKHLNETTVQSLEWLFVEESNLGYESIMDESLG